MEERSKPYVVSRLSGVGRCLLASRDLEPMEVIMVDAAAVTGPDEAAEEAVCVACYGPLTNVEEGGCEKCGLHLLCSQV